MDFQWSRNGPMFQEPRWRSCYSSQHLILLVGEGNFSFAASLGNAFGAATNIVATSLDSKDELLMKYGMTAHWNTINLMYRGALVFHSFDACTMGIQQKNLLGGFQLSLFHYIIFNFPHAGFLGKEDDAHVLKKHRELVSNFFANAKKMLLPGGQVHVRHKLGKTWDKWKLEELAHSTGLKLVGRVPFRRHQFPGYQNCRGNGFRPEDSFPLDTRHRADTFIYAVKDEEPPAKTSQIELLKTLAPSSKFLKEKALAKNSVEVSSSKTPEPLKPLVGEAELKALTSQVSSWQQNIANDEARLGKKLDNEKQVDKEKNDVKEMKVQKQKEKLEQLEKRKQVEKEKQAEKQKQADNEKMKTLETQTSASQQTSISNGGSVKATKPHTTTTPSPQVTKKTTYTVHTFEKDIQLSDAVIDQLKLESWKKKRVRQGRLPKTAPLSTVAASRMWHLKGLEKQLGDKTLRHLRMLESLFSGNDPISVTYPVSAAEVDPRSEVSSTKNIQVGTDGKLILDTAISEVTTIADSPETIIDSCPGSKQMSQSPEVQLSAPTDLVSEPESMKSDFMLVWNNPFRAHLFCLKDKAIRKGRASKKTTHQQVAADEVARLEKVKLTLGPKRLQTLERLKSALRILNSQIAEGQGNAPEEQIVKTKTSPSNGPEMSTATIASIRQKAEDRQVHASEFMLEDEEVAVKQNVGEKTKESVEPENLKRHCLSFWLDHKFSEVERATFPWPLIAPRGAFPMRSLIRVSELKSFQVEMLFDDMVPIY